jgi:hypothetical protein
MAAGDAVGAAPSSQACEARSNDTVGKLLECIQVGPLYGHLTDLQAISDANPTLHGHGNRDTGQPGYAASVNYVAGLMRQAGYAVTIQPYNWVDYHADPRSGFSAGAQAYSLGHDWFVARLSASGSVTARVEAVGPLIDDADGQGAAACSPRDFARFRRGDIALIERGGCALDAKVANAQAARAAGVILFNQPGPADQASIRGRARQGEAYQGVLETETRVPVVGVMAYGPGAALYRAAVAGTAPDARLDIRAQFDRNAIDYNVIAESPYGDANHVVVLEGHLDAIYGAGILDNGSGSSTMLEIALKMARTSTLNRLRYI